MLLVAKRPSVSSMLIHPEGWFMARRYDARGRLLWKERFQNGVNTLGFNYMLDAPFRNQPGGATLYPYWYTGLINNTPAPTLNVADTPSSHSGWVEDTADWTPATFSGAVNNTGGYASSTTTMTINGVSQAIPNGTGFTVTGATGTYVVTSSVGGATPTSITFTPGLSAAVANAAAISFNNARPLWTPSAASAKQITNPTSVNYAITTACTLAGIFVISDPTLAGTIGLLWSTGLFSAAQSFLVGDSLKITYNVSLS